nr:MAG TPA: hypothetical protein [Caudoviricetes sp.]
MTSYLLFFEKNNLTKLYNLIKIWYTISVIRVINLKGETK